MRIALAITAIAAAFVTPLGAASFASPPTATSPVATKAMLRVVHFTPLTLRGANFRSHESVRIAVTLSGWSATRQVRAGLLGGFTISFAGVRLERCGTPPAITARGVRTGLVRAFGLPRDCAMP